jgi:hypothetical protein
MIEIELHQISRKYESYRLKNDFTERQLLSSIAEKGISEPLTCVGKSTYVLLDGYKRLRCLSRLNIHIVPVHSLGSDEENGIIELIRISKNKSLQTLEQSCFIDELNKTFDMTVSAIAERLDVSPAWVSLRLGLIGEMSDTVKENIFSGEFPVRSYMYSLRPFTRVKASEKHLVDRFVSHVSGKKLSTRDMDRLIYGYFRGGEKLRRQIEEGNINWTLKVLKEKTASLSQEIELSADERRIISDLEILQKYMIKVIQHFADSIPSGIAFRKNASLLIKGISDSVKPLMKQIGAFYDQ